MRNGGGKWDSETQGKLEEKKQIKGIELKIVNTKGLVSRVLMDPKRISK